MLTTTRSHDHRSRRSHRDERGLALPLLALVLVGLLGVASLVVDLGNWQVEASKVQQAADAAALAGVVALPEGPQAAIDRAREVAAANGYDNDDDGVTVAVDPALGQERIEVAITTTNVQQFLSQVVRDDAPSITRRSTSQYVQPVPLGSPRNYLGTNDLMASYPGLAGTNAVENFFLAVSGECTQRENGDRITPRAMNIDNGNYSCTPPNNGTIDNPEREIQDRGYLFGVTVPEGAAGSSVRLQMFDAPHCPGVRAGTDFNTESVSSSSPVDYEVTVRRYDTLDPFGGSQIGTTQTYEGDAGGDDDDCRNGGPNADGECTVGGAFRDCWTTIGTLTSAAAGDYTIQVDPVFVNNLAQTHNQFALRAKIGGADTAFTPCSSDIAGTIVETGVTNTPPYSASCVQVYALEHLPLAAQGTSTPIFFLSSIDERHNGKVLEVTLFDTGEGASRIELLDPKGNPAMFSWEVLCADASLSPAAWSCPDGDAAPDVRGSGGGLVNSIDDLSDSGQQAFPNNSSPTRFNDRLLRLRVQLPTDIADAYDGATWWKIEYTGDFGGGAAFAGDRTTWSVRLLGDPVRLLPNTPTTTPGP